MKTLKKIGIGLLVLMGILLILSFVLSKEVNVRESYNFKAPKAYVFNLVNNVKTYPEWNAWITNDPMIELTFDDKTIGQGAGYSWTSDQSGSGSMYYDRVVGMDSIFSTMRFEGMSDSNVNYYFERDDGETKLTWELKSELGIPYNLMKLFFEFSIKKAYKQSFKNIENEIKNRVNGKYGPFQINEVQMKEKHYIMSRDEVAFSNIQRFYTRNLGAIFQKIQNEGLMMDGKPSGLFFMYDENKGVTDMAAAIPVTESISMEGLTSYTIPAGPAVSLDFYGDYAQTQNAHEAIDQYMKDRALLYNPPVVEEYVTDPLEEKDPNKWLTQIRYYFTESLDN